MYLFWLIFFKVFDVYMYNTAIIFNNYEFILTLNILYELNGDAINILWKPAIDKNCYLYAFKIIEN